MSRLSAWQGYVAVGLIGLLLALVHVWVRLQVVKVGYTLSTAQRLVRTLHGEQELLQEEWSKLVAPERLTTQATQQLGLEQPQAEQIIEIP